MKRPDDSENVLSALRELPPEVSVDQVKLMVAAFPLAVGITAWLASLIKFNLNSILMTTTGSIIVGTSAYLIQSAAPPVEPAHADMPEPVRVELVETAAPETLIEPAVVLTMPESKGPKLPEQRQEPEAMACMVVPKEEKDPAAIEPVPYEGAAPDPGAQPYPGAPPAEPAIPAEPLASLHTMDPAVVFTPSIVERSFDVKGFNGLALRSSLSVTVSQGEHAVIATGDPAMVERLKVSVEKGILNLDLGNAKRGADGGGCGALDITVRMPQVEKLEVLGSGSIRSGRFERADHLVLVLKGSGDVLVDGPEKANALSIEVSGSGDVFCGNVDVSGRTIIALAGSGDIRVTGRTESIDIGLIGSGDVDAGEFKASTAKVRITGSGDAEVNSASAVESIVTGSGRVNVSGSAGSERSRGVGNGVY